MPAASASGDSEATSTPVTPSTTVSSAPPRASATTGRPHACASTGTMPKSSSPGQQDDTRLAVQRRGSPRRCSLPRNSTPGPARLRAAGRLGPAADDAQRDAGLPAGVDGHVDPLVGNQRRHHQRRRRRHGGVRAEEVGVDGRIDHGRLAIIVSPDPARNVLRVREIAVHPVRRARRPTGPARPGSAAGPPRRPRRAAPAPK